MKVAFLPLRGHSSCKSLLRSSGVLSIVGLLFVCIQVLVLAPYASYSAKITQDEVGVVVVTTPSPSPLPPPRPPRVRGKIFMCGYDNTKQIRHLFPDYNYSGIFGKKTVSTAEDVLLLSLNGPCDLQSNHEEYFNGNIIYLNGEPFGRISKSGTTTITTSQTRTGTAASADVNRIFQLGGPMNRSESFPFDPNSNIVRVYFGAIFLLARGKEYWQKIFDPSQRPRFEKKTKKTTQATTHQQNHIVQAGRMSSPSSRPNRSKLIYVAGNCRPHRQSAVEKLSSILNVDHGGKCHIPNSHKVDPPKHWNSNYELYSKYEYCMAMENSQLNGYITEKILLAFLSGCIPIYWGTHEIFEVFNEKSFLFYDTNNPQAILDKISYMEQNQTAYDEMLRQPILKNGMATIDEYFSLSDDIGSGSLKRRIRTMMGIDD